MSATAQNLATVIERSRVVATKMAMKMGPRRPTREIGRKRGIGMTRRGVARDAVAVAVGVAAENAVAATAAAVVAAAVVLGDGGDLAVVGVVGETETGIEIAGLVGAGVAAEEAGTEDAGAVAETERGTGKEIRTLGVALGVLGPLRHAQPPRSARGPR
jgi:hypothetical protein